MVLPLCNRSYLLGRQQYVRISAKVSSLGASYHGVPQGSILGPYLPSSLKTFLTSQNLVLWNHTLTIQNSVCHFLSTMHAAWSSRLLTIYRSQRLGAACYNILLINQDRTKLMVLGTQQYANATEASTETLNPVFASYRDFKFCICQFYSCVDLRTIFQNTCRIKSFFPYKDCLNCSPRSKVIYKASCWDCNDFYIDKTN